MSLSSASLKRKSIVLAETELLTPYAKKLPAPIKTGDDLMNLELDSKHGFLQTLISDCQRDGGNISVAVHAINERKKLIAAKVAINNSATFKSASTVRRLDDAFKMDIISLHTTVSLAACERMYSNEDIGPDDVNYIFGFLTQLRLELRLPECLSSLPVAKAYFTSRILDIKRHDLITPSILKANGALDRTKLTAYSATFAADGSCKELLHTATKDKLVMTKDFLKKGNFSFIDGHSDVDQAIKFGDIPPMKISAMWKDKMSGPFLVPQYFGTKCQDRFKEAVLTVYDGWIASEALASATTSSTSVLAVAKFQQARQSKVASKAREAAQKKMTSKQTRRVINVTG
jgi:hypothetical protein